MGTSRDVRIRYVSPGRIAADAPAGARQGGRLDALLSLHPRLVYAMRYAQWLAYERYLAHVAVREGIDVVHESFYTPARIKRAAVQVFTLHDLSLVRFPQTHSADRRLFFDRFFPSRLAEADHVIVPSVCVKQELLDYARFDEDSVSVIAEGVDACFAPRGGECVASVLARHGIPSEYFLFVGTLEPRKNLSVLLKAMSRDSSGLPLVIAGWSGWGDPAFQSELARLGLGGRVVFPGYLDDEELAALYSGAVAFLYPSLYEGFGLPVLEAMACGCPVVCSNVASIPEVAGEAALYADPMKPEEWAAAMESLVNNGGSRSDLVRAGLARAGLFSWDAAAEETLALFRRLRRR
jgi:alpha-1,3-rhamnosyl/mannosyltransferase